MACDLVIRHGAPLTLSPPLLSLLLPPILLHGRTTLPLSRHGLQNPIAAPVLGCDANTTASLLPP